MKYNVKIKLDEVAKIEVLKISRYPKKITLKITVGESVYVRTLTEKDTWYGSVTLDLGYGA